MRAFETPEILLTLGGGGERGKESYLVPGVNKPRAALRFGIACHEIPFVWLTCTCTGRTRRDATRVCIMYTRYYTRSRCMSARARILYPYARSTRIPLYTLDSIGVVLAPIRIPRWCSIVIGTRNGRAVALSAYIGHEKSTPRGCLSWKLNRNAGQLPYYSKRSRAHLSVLEEK